MHLAEWYHCTHIVCSYHAHTKCAQFAARTCPGLLEEEPAANPFAMPKGKSRHGRMDLDE
jgi:hypothetical protein